MNQTPKDSKDSTSTTKAQEKKKTKDAATSAVIIHSIIFSHIL
jgi:diacylglycerol kinase